MIKPDGGPAVRIRTIRRLVEAERWNPEAVDAVRARPRQPDPRGRTDNAQQSREHQQPQPAAAGSGGDPSGLVPEGAGLPSGRIMPDENVRHRDFRITKRMVESHEPTEGCPGCNAAMRPGTRGNHTRECRLRFEEILSRTEAGRVRIHQRDVRHGLAEPPEQVEVEREAGEERGEEAQDEGVESQDRGVSSDEPNVRRRPADDVDPGEPSAQRPRVEESNNARNDRQRVEERRGQRRGRDSDADSGGEDDRPSRYRRVGALEKAIADVISIRTDFAKERN